MTFVYVIAFVAIVQGVIALLDGIRAARYMRRTSEIRNPKSEIRNLSVLVFCPCKGIDPEFGKNIQSILDQDHSNFIVQFIVESKDDPAHEELRRLGVSNILVAGKATDCGQKVHNLLAAVSQPANQSDVYAFCDSDARYPRHWLSHLTRPLLDSTVAVATGYRWYIAETANVPTLLRSAWNASIVSMLGNHDGNFAWGGSMAFRRQTFEDLGIRQAWQGALSDDYAVTRAARQAGARIVFVPSCLIPTFGECTWGELFEFTTRQIIITRVYHPRLWRIGFLAQSIFAVAFIASIAVPALWSAIYLLAAAKSWIRVSAVTAVLGPAALSKHTWFYILSAPIVALLFEYNMLRSAFSREIIWRQIRYSLISPNQTRVLQRDGSAADAS